ncbi:MAG: undecaprenyldiphospho-muramoylpentapeptide beta-N-acetylglucosaminyltransferase, partial [Actinomycetota bacterium]
MNRDSVPPGDSGGGGRMKVVIAGGGTGGHVYPGVVLAEALAERGGNIVFMGSPTGPEARVAVAAGLAFQPVDVIGLERTLTPRNLVALAKLTTGTGRALAFLRRFQPDVVVGTGGYVSLPVALAAGMRRIPLIVHEQNAIPGLANAVAGRFADAVAVSFPGSGGRFGARARLTGNPVRPEIAAFNRTTLREAAIRHFELEGGRRTLLIFGGSQGAMRINQAALSAYGRFRDSDRLQVLHLTGARALEDAQRRLAQVQRCEDRVLWRLVGYTDSMHLAYAAADLALCRSGATTIAELAGSGLPAILVPYPHATGNHQLANARALAATGGATIVGDGDLDEAAFAGAVGELVFDRSRLGRMAEAAARLSVPDARERLASLVVEMAGRRRSQLRFPEL